MSRLLIFGLGYSALHFARSHRADFMAIDATVRTPDKAARLAAEGFAMHVFDTRQGDDGLVHAIEQADAALVSIAPDEAGDPVLDAYGERLAGAPRLRTLVYLSTVGVYGDHGGAWVDEKSVLKPVSERSRRRVAAEAAWTEFGARTGKAVHILRLAGIYGPGRNALVNLKAGTARRVVKPGQVFNRIHVEDIARAITAALAHPHVGGIWNVADDEPAPPQDVVAYAAARLGVPVPPDVPFEEAELSPMGRSFYGENKRVSNRALRGKLGGSLAFPTYREGLDSLAASGEGA
jgi:nucleoside-diphosphate-sugar epimerase